MNAVELIKSNINVNSILAILHHYDADRVHSFNDTIRCCCPLHKGNNPTSFVWKANNGLWYCHTSCNEGGDIFDFIAKSEGLNAESDFRQIIFKIANILNLDINNIELGKRTVNHEREFREWKNIILRKTRVAHIQEFDLNTLGELLKITKYRNYTKEILDLYEVTYCKEQDRIVLPIRSIDGIIIGATMRRRDNTNPLKWLHKPTGLKVGETFFGLHLIQTQVPVIVEGAFDVMSLRQNGIEAIGCFGAKLTDEQVKILMKHFTKVALMYDGDKAGHDATLQAIGKLQYKMDIDIYALPPGKDPGDITIDDISELKVYKANEYIKQFNEVYA